MIQVLEIIYLLPQTEKTGISEVFGYLQAILLHYLGFSVRDIFVIWAKLVQKCPNWSTWGNKYIISKKNPKNNIGNFPDRRAKLNYLAHLSFPAAIST